MRRLVFQAAPANKPMKLTGACAPAAYRRTVRQTTTPTSRRPGLGIISNDLSRASKSHTMKKLPAETLNAVDALELEVLPVTVGIVLVGKTAIQWFIICTEVSARP